MGEATVAGTAVAKSIRALSERARGLLVPVTPAGPLGSPFEGYPLGAVTVDAQGTVEVRLGEDHLRYLLTDPRIVHETTDSLTLSASDLTEEFVPYGQTEAATRVRRWTDAELLLTFDPEIAQGLR